MGVVAFRGLFFEDAVERSEVVASQATWSLFGGSAKRGLTVRSGYSAGTGSEF